jgi:ribosomal protein S18 acetylase RimI-like enzyme
VDRPGRLRCPSGCTSASSPRTPAICSDSRPAVRLIFRARLSPDERAAVEALKAVCDAHDGVDQPLHIEDALCPALLDYSDGVLTGVATLQIGASLGPVEVCGLVDPRWRRRGIGRRLLAAVRDECRRRGQGLLLTLHHGSASGRGFALAVGARYSSSEYRLELLELPAEREWPVRLEIRPAGRADAATFARVLAAADREGEDSGRRAWVEQGMRRRRHRYYLGELAGDAVATIRVSSDPGPVYITSFAVLPELQGRGYGRQVLTRVVRQLAAEGRRPILIEVATDNPNALGLYRSCGFRERSAYDYFQVEA